MLNKWNRINNNIIKYKTFWYFKYKKKKEVIKLIVWSIPNIYTNKNIDNNKGNSLIG